MKNRAISAFLIIIFAFIGYFVYKSDRVSPSVSPRLAKYAFKLGLDLNGGTELTYKADISKVKGDVSGAMSSPSFSLSPNILPRRRAKVSPSRVDA